MNYIKKPQLSDIYYFCSKLMSKDEPTDDTLEIVQSNIIDMRKMGSFLKKEWPIDRRLNPKEVLATKAAYLTYHLYEGNHFSQRKFIFSKNKNFHFYQIISLKKFFLKTHRKFLIFKMSSY
mgnify:CR=1 FL=1